MRELVEGNRKQHLYFTCPPSIALWHGLLPSLELRLRSISASHIVFPLKWYFPLTLPIGANCSETSDHLGWRPKSIISVLKCAQCSALQPQPPRCIRYRILSQKSELKVIAWCWRPSKPLAGNRLPRYRYLPIGRGFRNNATVEASELLDTAKSTRGTW